MSHLVIRGDARCLALPDESVDLIITSPPYFALRSYRDGDEHYDGQIGSEPTPQEFLEALWTCTAEWWRVLRPGGSLWVNLGDKYAGSGGHNNSGISGKSTLSGNGHSGGVGKAGANKIKRTPRTGGGEGRRHASRRDAPDAYNKATIGGAREKSLMGLPWRYALGCIDGRAAPGGQAWILRAEVVWSKPNGLPESVTDRVRRSHEQWFHMTKEPRYFAAVGEVRESYAQATLDRGPVAPGKRALTGNHNNGPMRDAVETGTSIPVGANPLGKLPGSVWDVVSEPLRVPEYLIEWDDGYRLCDPPAHWLLAQRLYAEGYTQIIARDIDHFAAFPTEWPRRIILGWSPSGICTACGEGRRPVTDKSLDVDHVQNGSSGRRDLREPDGNSRGLNGPHVNGRTVATIIGYACSCTPYTDHPERAVPSIHSPTERVHTAARAALDDPRNWPERQSKRDYHFDRWTPAPTRPAVVLDPFGGTGTTAMVAKALGRVGISVDLSADYCRLARWRIEESGHSAKVSSRTDAERQGQLL